MGTVLGKLFVDVTQLPQDNYGLAILVYLGATYAFVLLKSSTMIKDGSELLLLIPKYAGIVGSIVLPVLGAVPDGAIVLFSGMGPNAVEQVSVGVGALAGSTVMLLTIPWFLSLMAGRVNLDKDGVGNYIKPKGAGKDWAKLSPPDRTSGTGATVGPLISYNAKVMLVTLAPFFIIQVPSLLHQCAYLAEEKHCTPQGNAALVGGIVAVALFVYYLYDQAQIANSDAVKKDKIDQLRATAIKSNTLTLRGLFPDQCMDSEGSIHISADNKRFRDFLKPFFSQFDMDKSGDIDKTEFTALVRSLGETPTKAVVDKMMADMDTDNSGSISFDEFVTAMSELLVNRSITKVDDGAVEVVAHEQEGNEDDDEEQEDEIPDDLVGLSPEEQQSRILKRSCWQMLVGVTIVLVFSDPMVAVLSELGNRVNVKPFYVAFVLAPLASNASELIAAYSYALKKTEKTMTISLSTLLGAACMNNTFSLAIFLGIVYFQNLKWVFSAETTSIVTVELIMFFVAQQRVQHTWYAYPILALFPLCALQVYAMEAYGFD